MYNRGGAALAPAPPKQEVRGETLYEFQKLPEPVIRVLIQDNPKRLGSASYTRFTYYDDGITVSEYFRRGGRPSDIKWDLEHHYIKLETVAQKTLGPAESTSVQ